MRRKNLFVAALMVVVTVVGILQFQKETEVSDLVLANVEALASGQMENSLRCFNVWRKAPNTGLAFLERICSDCKAYWLLEASDRGDCNLSN